MSSDKDSFGEIRQRALIFAALCVLAVIVLVALIGDVDIERNKIATLELLSRLRDSRPGLGRGEAMGLVVMGLGAGFLAGCIGMGGGVLKVAGLLILFRHDIFFARAVSLVTMFIASAVSLTVYAEQRWAIKKIVAPMLAAAVFAAVAGALLGNVIHGTTLTLAFGLFLLLLGLQALALVLADPDERILESSYAAAELERPSHGTSASIGAVHGFVCGLLGISGGVVSTPLQQMLLRVPARRAVANTLVVSVAVTGIAAIIAVTSAAKQRLFSLERLVYASACVSAGAFMGAYIGARISRQLDTMALRLLFAAVAITAGSSVLF